MMDGPYACSTPAPRSAATSASMPSSIGVTTMLREKEGAQAQRVTSPHDEAQGVEREGAAWRQVAVAHLSYHPFSSTTAAAAWVAAFAVSASGSRMAASASHEAAWPSSSIVAGLTRALSAGRGAGTPRCTASPELPRVSVASMSMEIRQEVSEQARTTKSSRTRPRTSVHVPQLSSGRISASRGEEEEEEESRGARFR
eukprot:4963876-Prymnesium_polylepis.1